MAGVSSPLVPKAFITSGLRKLPDDNGLIEHLEKTPEGKFNKDTFTEAVAKFEGQPTEEQQAFLTSVVETLESMAPAVADPGARTQKDIAGPVPERSTVVAPSAGVHSQQEEAATAAPSEQARTAPEQSPEVESTTELNPKQEAHLRAIYRAGQQKLGTSFEVTAATIAAMPDVECRNRTLYALEKMASPYEPRLSNVYVVSTGFVVAERLAAKEESADAPAPKTFVAVSTSRAEYLDDRIDIAKGLHVYWDRWNCISPAARLRQHSLSFTDVNAFVNRFKDIPTDTKERLLPTIEEMAHFGWKDLALVDSAMDVYVTEIRGTRNGVTMSFNSAASVAFHEALARDTDPTYSPAEPEPELRSSIPAPSNTERPKFGIQYLEVYGGVIHGELRLDRKGALRLQASEPFSVRAGGEQVPAGFNFSSAGQFGKTSYATISTIQLDENVTISPEVAAELRAHGSCDVQLMNCQREGFRIGFDRGSPVLVAGSRISVTLDD